MLIRILFEVGVIRDHMTGLYHPSAATGEADFRSTRAELEFNASVLSRTVTIEIFDDMFLEMNEEFTSVLTLNTTDVSVMLMPGEATITILDNDRMYMCSYSFVINQTANNEGSFYPASYSGPFEQLIPKSPSYSSFSRHQF